MARNTIGDAPFPVCGIESDAPLSVERVIQAVDEAGGSASLCVRSVHGHANRGGYFCHVEKIEGGQRYRIYDFERHPVATLEPEYLVRFINHISGRQFDGEMLVFCQETVNIRLDQTEGGADV